MSQLLLRIEDRLRSEQDPNLRGELIAQQASYLARIGQFSETRRKIAELRTVFGDGRSGRVTAFIMLAEGLLLHYEQLGPNALDRVSRAQLLGQAMKDRDVIGLASAWRAHLEFEQSRYSASAKSLRIALENSSDQDHAARARCAIVLFNAFALCGNRPESQRWFLSGREHALKAGDQASIDALLHSRAAFGLAWLRVQRCKGEVDATSLSIVRSEIASARNLQRLTQIEAHATYIDLCDARLQIVEGRYQTAIDLLNLIRNAGPFPSGHFSQALLDLEIAFCQSKMGDIESAVSAVDLVQVAAHDALDVDDRLVASWMTLEVAKLDSRLESTDEARHRLDTVSREYDVQLEVLRSEFAEFAGN